MSLGNESIFQTLRVLMSAMTTMRSCFRIVTLSFVFLMLTVAGSAGEGALEELPKVVAVIPADFPPTYFCDPKDGKAAGLAVDVMNELARKAGLRVEYRFGEAWDEIENMLLTGQADLIPFRVINDKTKEKFAFTQTLDTAPVNYIVRASDTATTGPAPGKKVGVIRGGTAYERLKDDLDLTVIPYEGPQHLLMDLFTGKIDLILTTTDNLLSLAVEAGLKEKLRVIVPPVFEVQRAIAFRPDSEALGKRLREAVESFDNTLEQKRIYERWLGKPEPWWTVQKVLLGSGGCLALVLVSLLIWRFVGIQRLNGKLDAERRFLQTMIDAIPEPIIFKNRESVYIGCNDFFARDLLGLPKDQIIGRTDLDLMKDKALAELFRQRDKEAMAAGQPRGNDEWITLADGRAVLVETLKIPFCNESGEIAGLIGVARDVTERNRAERLQVDARRRLQTFLDNMPMLAWLKDAEGRFEMVNVSFAKACGQSVEEVIGKTDLDVWPREFAEAYRSDDARVMACGEKSRVEEQIGFGEEICWFTTFKTPIRNEAGEVTGTAGIAQDITEQRVARDALLRSEAKYRSLSHEFKSVLEAIPDSLSLTSPDFKLVWANSRAIENMMARDACVVGQPCYKLWHMRETACEECPVQDVLNTGTITEFTRRRNEETWDFRLIPIKDADSGKVINVVRLGRDITQTTRLEAQLRQAQKLEAIGTLAGGIAHDFNNILAPIIGYAGMALDEVPESHPIHKDLQQILTAANRAKDLVRQILAFSRKDREHPMVAINVDMILREALKLLRATLPSTIEIRQQVEKGVALIDATEIHQVVVNLCVNAAHAMDSGGVLDISLTHASLGDSDCAGDNGHHLTAGAYLKLSVADTGHGMDAETVQKIFEPYFTTKGLGKGTGLGLAVVHGIVKRHGGEIRVESKPGQGSRFEVYLPAASAEPVEVILSPESQIGGSERVLFVDDEQAIVDIGSRMLGQLGYQVTTETRAANALEYFRSHPHELDLVITDFTMPHLTGIDMAAQMLKIRPDIPIIVCTGFHENATDEAAKAMGVRELVMKPLGKKQLAHVVRKVLDGKS
jgi:PAS domain S-box-containing protein